MVFLKTGAYEVPSKSQIPTILGEECYSSIECLQASWACCWRHLFGTNNYPPFRHSTQNHVIIPSLDFLFLAKIRLEITNIWCGVIGNLSENKNKGFKTTQRWCKDLKIQSIKYRGFLPYANFITANFITAIFQNIP
jgi:hypothetical protein